MTCAMITPTLPLMRWYPSAIAATSPSCLPTMSFWSPSSASAAKIPVSAEPGFVKRYSTPASFSVWMSSMPPVPVIVLRMMSLAVVVDRRRVRSGRAVLAKQRDEVVDHGGLTEHGAQHALAVGRRKVAHHRVASTGFLDQHLARRQVPHVVVHVHHRVGGAHDHRSVSIGRPVDPMVRVTARQDLEEIPLIEMAREVEPGAQHEAHRFGPLARRARDEPKPLTVPVTPR